MQSKGKFSCQVNQYVRYVHCCLELATLIKMSTNNPCQKSVVLDSSVKPIQQTKLGLVENSRPTDSGYKQKLLNIHYSQDSPLSPIKI